ncbi:MAG: branched-chain amino acid ABC transporter substrate-binding protein [Armatimonadota bacterium]|nr:branched-chain amino acid ABC transporter substrate-binding protein [Armatimonadota bacterium]MDR7611759.1 branched-chain amino acid ABC transporter substrate-binding protein [Armatimonadota bacterium]
MAAVLRIGFAAPLTGDQAVVGVPMARCAEMALIDARRAGWLSRRVALEAVDDRADPAWAREVARRFAQDPRVIGVVGHKNSGPSAAAAPVYNAADVVQVTPSATAPDLSRQGYRTFFRLCAHDGRQALAAARAATQILGARRLAVVHDGTGYGRPLARAFSSAVRAVGADLRGALRLVPGAGAHPRVVECVRRLRPDLVFCALTEIDSSALVRDLRAAGVGVRVLGTDGGAGSLFPRLAGPAGEGTYHTYAGSVPAGPMGRAFTRACRKWFGAPPPYGAEVYDAVTVLLAALATVGQADRAAVLAEVKQTDRIGVTGRLRFNRYGDRVDPQVTLWRVRQGRMELVDRLT